MVAAVFVVVVVAAVFVAIVIVAVVVVVSAVSFFRMVFRCAVTACGRHNSLVVYRICHVEGLHLVCGFDYLVFHHGFVV